MSETTDLDPQDPLPESGWTWRRLFVFLSSAILLYIVWENLNEIGSVAKASAAGSETAIAGQVTITKYALAAFALNQLFYLVAPSAEQITRIVQAARAMRSGVRFTQTQTTTTREGQEVDQSTAGLPPEPEHDADSILPPPPRDEIDAAPTARKQV